MKERLARRRRFLLIVAALAITPLFHSAKAQDIALKTNLLYDATATANLGVEIGLAPRWTIDLSGNLNAWKICDEAIWKHWLFQPEFRWWFCDRFSGFFLALQLHGGQYNAGDIENGIDFLGTDFSALSDYRFQGWFVGAGVGIGHSWILGRHWSLEAEIALGYSYTVYDKFDCANCDEKVADDKDHHYIGPTKAALNLIYVF